MNALGALIMAIMMVESSGNDQAVGSDGLSYGPLQITDVCREDVNRIAGTHYTRQDCFDPSKAKEMFSIYIAYYCASERLGHEPQWEDVARVWNGGPTGWSKPATLAFWAKVRTTLGCS